LENNPNLLLVACDKDPEALARAEVKLEKYKERFCLLQSNFADLEQIVNSLPKAFCELLSAKTKFPLFDRILLDLGISSDQLDDDQRGFSFMREGPLDMRMSDRGLSAADVLNTYSESELRKLFLIGGVKKPYHQYLTKEIIHKRPINTTLDFAEICKKVFFKSQRKTNKQTGKSHHPATVPFQALRIEVNKEFDAIKTFMSEVLDYLAPGGILAVISFHSLEDQFVTRAMRDWTETPLNPTKISLKTRATTLGKLLTKKAVTPTDSEIESNPRSRSARLRVFEKTSEVRE
ncbi:MAG: 16S rRNA (cytosine(1402)-N(4))-methyltransferase RsmH, partial [Proteobacteria bacterium]|nr:16S rRNA (cytosine(1402)-N(4))-methyltransferase RsmH [Pseudomonadota bacterium]